MTVAEKLVVVSLISASKALHAAIGRAEDLVNGS